MKELSLNQIEMVSGGECSFMEMMYYASAQMYHMTGLPGASERAFAYHAAAVGYFNGKLVGCM